MKNTIRICFAVTALGVIIGTIAGGLMLDIDRCRIGERAYFQLIALLATWAVIEFNA
jgi:ABC-type spermidine/putrescine transport system permease subunit II